MSDLSLSQDEIDALLMGSPAPSSTSKSKKSLSSQELESFSKYLAGATASQSSAIAGMMDGKSVTIQPPILELLDKDGLLDNLSQEVLELKVEMSGDVNSEHSFFFSPDDAITLISPIMGQESVELTPGTINALEEVASMLSGAMVTSVGTASKKNFSPGPCKGSKFPKAMVMPPTEDLVVATYRISLGNKDLKMVEYFEASFAKALTSLPKEAPTASSAMSPEAMGFGSQPQGGQGGQPQMGGYGMPQGGQPMNLQQFPQGYGGMPQMPMSGYGMPQGGYPNVQGVQLPNLIPGGGPMEQGNIGLLMDVSMEVTVELGRAKRQIKDILGMGEGTIIALDKLAGEAVDILVNHKLIAKGEVVVIDENFGVRVTEIVVNSDKMGDN